MRTPRRFAPPIMGVTVGLFALLSRTFADAGEGVEMMPIWLFAAVVGVYLVLMVLVISHFCPGCSTATTTWSCGGASERRWRRLVFAGAVFVAYTDFLESPLRLASS